MPPQPGTPQEPPHQQQQQQQQEEDVNPPQQEQQQQQQQQQTPVKRRGRPPGVKNKATLAKAGTAGPLMAFVLQVQPGEDVAAKLQDLAATRSCSLTVVAASGALATATLQQCSEADPGGTACVGVALSGSFTILSISGSILQPAALPPEKPSTQQQLATPPAAAAAAAAAGPQQSLSASLANASGGVVGGVVAGPLVAAAPVRLVLGLFGQPA